MVKSGTCYCGLKCDCYLDPGLPDRRARPTVPTAKGLCNSAIPPSNLTSLGSAGVPRALLCLFLAARPLHMGRIWSSQ